MAIELPATRAFMQTCTPPLLLLFLDARRCVSAPLTRCGFSLRRREADGSLHYQHDFPRFDSACTEGFRRVVHACLQKYPQHRPSAAEALQQLQVRASALAARRVCGCVPVPVSFCRRTVCLCACRL